jgi:hypothetical protein
LILLCLRYAERDAMRCEDLAISILAGFAGAPVWLWHFEESVMISRRCVDALMR